MEDYIKSTIIVALILIGMYNWFIGLGEYFIFVGEVKECENYRDYGYSVKINSDYWDTFFGQNEVCLIYMEDGTMLPLRDYKVMSLLIYMEDGTMLPLRDYKVMSLKSAMVRGVN